MKTFEQIADTVLTKLSKDKSHDKLRRGGVATGGMLAGSAVQRLLDPAVDRTAISMFDSMKGTEVDTKKLLKQFSQYEETAKLPVNTVDNVLQSSYSPRPAGYMTKLRELALGKDNPIVKMTDSRKLNLQDKVSPFIAAHEVGHASGGKFRQALIRHRLPIMLGSGFGGLGLLAHAAMTGEKGEGMGATGYAAPAVAAVSPVISQMEELAATLKAKKLLNKSGINVRGLGKIMGKQQLNYILSHAAGLAPIATGSLLLHHYLKNKGKDVPNA